MCSAHIESMPEVESCLSESDVRYEVAASYLPLPTQTGRHFHFIVILSQYERLRETQADLQYLTKLKEFKRIPG